MVPWVPLILLKNRNEGKIGSLNCSPRIRKVVLSLPMKGIDGNTPK
jgi:hypothetical protein